MDILNKPIDSFSFEDVVDFCKQGFREGTQLDYKKELSKDGFSKHFASFSNTKGGVLVIGVEEDKKTGIPLAWEGITNNAKDVERINQWATSVEPIPNYEVHVTDEVKGKVFILVRVFEGEQTPYYVQNDAKVYVRTGNITSPIDLASPEMLELLFGKEEKAELARSLYINRSWEIYEAGLRRAERERLKCIAIEKEDYERKKKEVINKGETYSEYNSHYYQSKLGSEASLLTVLIQPYYPKESLINPLDIRNRTQEIRDSNSSFRLNFPSLNHEPIQDGIMNFEWGNDDGEIKNEQIYSAGLVRLSFDVLNVNKDDNSKIIYLSHIVSLVFGVLKASSNFYKMVGYQGGLIGYILINGSEGVSLEVGLASRSFFPGENKIGLMPKYRLDLSIDTSILNDDKNFQSYFIGLIKEIYWSLGCGEISDNLIISYLKDRNWFVDGKQEAAET